MVKECILNVVICSEVQGSTSLLESVLFEKRGTMDRVGDGKIGKKSDTGQQKSHSCNV